MSKIKEQFETLRDECLSCQDKDKELHEKIQKEVNASARKIRLSYKDEINLSKKECLDSQKNFEDYKKLLETYSTFDSQMIGNIIAKLVSIVEGEEYSYQEAEHQTFEYDSTVFGNELLGINKKVLMIVKGSQRQECYCDYTKENNEIKKLVGSGEALVLSENKFGYDKKIKFYTAKEDTVESLIDFNRFSYVENFINTVVQYRFENHLNKISKEDVLDIMKKFILSEKEMIEENLNKSMQEQLKKLIKGIN